MKKVFLASALMLLSSQALAEVDQERIIAGSGATQTEAEGDALNIADKYCQEKFNLSAEVVDYTDHPLSSKELYMVILSYICTKKGTKN